MSKYAELDARVFRWLSAHRTDVSTAAVFKALRVTDPVQQRHIQRRFTQLEYKGVLICTLRRTERICRVVSDPPTTLARKKWAPKPAPAPIVSNIPSIPAENSTEFEQAGGIIERLQTSWGKRITRIPLGESVMFDLLNDPD